jgi:hypothetical protein
MAKLPTRDDMGAPPSARSGRPIASVDTSAAAKGQIALGRGISAVGEAGMDIYKHQQHAEEYDAELKFQQFKWAEEDARDEAMRKVEPGQAGSFPDTWRSGYAERAKGFKGGIPEALRDKYDARLRLAERELFRPAATFARTEQQRYAGVALDEFREQYMPKSGDPQAVERFKGDYEGVIERSPWLTPIQKDELKRKGFRDIEQTHVTTLLSDRTKARDVLRDLGYGPEAEAEPQAAAGTAEEQASKGVGVAQPGQPAQPRGPVRSFPAPVNAAITAAAQKHGVDPGLLATFARIESSGRPGAQTGSYKGLFQLSESEFRKHGGEGDIFDADANADAAARKLKAEAASFELKHGKPPSALDLYLVHQQGEAGYASHMARPDAPAWENMAGTGEGRQKGASWAKQAIWGNIPDDMKKRFPDGVESITSQDFVGIWGEKVARLGGGDAGTGPRAPSSPDTYTGPYRHLTAEDRLKHATAARAALKQEAAEVAQDVRAFESIAEQGFAPKPGQMDALRKRVESGADAETRQSFMQAEQIVTWQNAARMATPEELDIFVRSETERLRKGGATAFDAKRVAMADKLLTNMRAGLKSDPLGWADRVGLVAVQPVDFSTPETAQASLGLRVKQAEAVAERYGLEPKYLREDEKQKLTAAIEAGGEQALDTAAKIAASAGDHAPAILSEISKNSPTAAILGGMVTETGMSAAARDAADGIALRKEAGFQTVAPSKKESRSAVTAELGASLSGMPQAETAVIDAANAIYEVRARKQQLTEYDAGVWQQALREVVGERKIDGKTYGGVVDADPSWRGGRRIIIPPFVAQDGWRDVIEATSMQDLWQSGLGVPSGGDGQPVSINRVKGAILVQSGNGRYMLSLGNPDLPGEEKWIMRQDAPSEPYEIDLYRLRPILQPRRPELFLGAPPVSVPQSSGMTGLGE